MTDQSNTSQALAPATPSPSRPTSRIGGSLLPSSDPFILRPMPGIHGTFQVRPMPDLDTYGLFLTKTTLNEAKPHEPTLLAMHPNGYSCHCLAERILMAWEGKRDVDYAMSQFDYILACGGMGRSRGTIEYFARGLKHKDEAPPAVES